MNNFFYQRLLDVCFPTYFEVEKMQLDVVSNSILRFAYVACITKDAPKIPFKLLKSFGLVTLSLSEMSIVQSDFWASVDGQTGRQKVIRVRPPCKMHRWAKTRLPF